MKLLNLYVRQNIKTITCCYIHYRMRAYFLHVYRTSQTETSLLIKPDILHNKYPSNPFMRNLIYTTVPKVRT